MVKKTLLPMTLAIVLLSIARAADPPPLKEGLWEISGQSIENSGSKHTDFKYQLCRNHAYDNAMDRVVKNAKAVPPRSTTWAAGISRPPRAATSTGR